MSQHREGKILGVEFRAPLRQGAFSKAEDFPERDAKLTIKSASQT